MAALVDDPEDVEGFARDLIIDEIRKRPALAAWKSVGADVVAALPFDDGSHRLFHPLVEIVGKAR